MVKHRKHEKDFYAFSKGHVVPVEGEDMSDEINSRLADGYVVTLLGDTTIKKTLLMTVSNTGIDGNGYRLIMATEAGAFDNDVYNDRYSISTASGKKYAVGIDCRGTSDTNRIAGCFVRNVRTSPDAWIDLRYLKPINHEYTTGFEVSDCEIWGFSRTRGHVTGNNVNGSRILRNYIHDSYTNATTGTDVQAQITGIEIDGDADSLVDENGERYASRDLLVQGNRIINMTMSSAARAARGHQTDGINLQGITTTDTTSKPTRQFKIIGNDIRNCGEGIDCFGSYGVIAGNTIQWCVFGVKNVYGSSHVSITGNVFRFIAEGAWYCGGAGSGVYANLDGHVFSGNNVSAMKPKADWYSADGSKMYDYVAEGNIAYRNSAASACIKLVMPGGSVINTVSNALIDGNTFDVDSPDLGYGTNSAATIVLHENGTGGSPTNRVGTNRIISYSPGVYNDGSKYLIIERGYPVTKTGSFTLGDDEHDIIVDNSSGTTNVTLPTASRHPARRVRIRTIRNKAVNATSSVVVPIAGGAAGTAILAATAGNWCELVSNGTNWSIVEEGTKVTTLGYTPAAAQGDIRANPTTSDTELIARHDLVNSVWNGSFDLGNYGFVKETSGGTGWAIGADATNARLGRAYVASNNNTSGANLRLTSTSKLVVDEGDIFFGEAWVKTTVGATFTTCRATAQFYDKDGNSVAGGASTVGNNISAATTSWVRTYFSGTVPATAVFAVVSVRVDNKTVGTIYAADLFGYKRRPLETFGSTPTAAATPANFSAAYYIKLTSANGTDYYMPVSTTTW